jgi:HSP20 family molecular chaperone IbpA
MGNEGKQTLAYNLPNVEAWTEKYGTKKVMLINIMEGKFNLILKPIGDLVLRQQEQAYIDSGMFSDSTVRHEVSHGIGPATIKIKTDKGMITTTSREQLQQYFSAFEEAKAEIVSLLFGYHLIDNKVFSKDAAFNENFAKRMATNYVVSAFRTIRFGVSSDHAKGKLFEFNRLTQNGAINFHNGRYDIDFEKFPKAVEKLAMEIIDLEMFGNTTKAKELLDTVGNAESDTTYPPYNIERLAENTYRITMAVAGFSEPEIRIEVKETALLVKGEKKPDTEGRHFLHRGIAARQFQRAFLLADGMEVMGADLSNGLLSIDLIRPEPERVVRRIDILARD